MLTLICMQKVEYTFHCDNTLQILQHLYACLILTRLISSNRFAHRFSACSMSGLIKLSLTNVAGFGGGLET